MCVYTEQSNCQLSTMNCCAFRNFTKCSKFPREKLILVQYELLKKMYCPFTACHNAATDTQVKLIGEQNIEYKVWRRCCRRQNTFYIVFSLENIIGLQKSFFPPLFERIQNKMKQKPHTHTHKRAHANVASIHQTIIICHFCFVTKTIKIIKHGVYNQLVRSSDLMFYICAQRMSQMSSRTHTHTGLLI